ncbi:MAG: hypothetical protein J2P48_02250 [Alphaproteobacteria bacterium]|nr:hypothetical protein [Alphaproteobacteria bacterium]
MEEFRAIENRLGPQARITVLLVLLSGLYMLYSYNLWDRFTQSQYWWMHLMVGVWLLFAALLFVFEPLVICCVLEKRARAASPAVLIRMLWMHRAILASSLAVIFAAVGGSHGLF